MNRYRSSVLFSLLVTACGLTAGSLIGCVAAPEHCRGCLAALADAGFPDLPGAEVAAGGTGGVVVGTGGEIGSGGMTGTGGGGTGGAGGTGGVASGGSSTGGAASGGSSTGGAASGGSSTGGAASGGRGTGGAATGGSGTGGAGGSGMGGATIDPDLVLWYKLDDNAGTTTATDSAMFGGMARNGTLMNVGTGTAAFSTTRQVGSHSVNLTSSSATIGGYVTVPSLQALAPNAVTIATWVYVKSNQNWQRVYDFGITATPPAVYMFLTTNQMDTATTSSVRFAISNAAAAAEQPINMTTPATLSLNMWHHVVVVLPAGATYTGTLYIDGTARGTNPAMTFHPTSLGATTGNYLGKSQFASDPYFNGQIDDFRVYRRALTAAEVAALYLVR